MAKRALTFAVRKRGGGRTVRVKAHPRVAGSWLVEVERDGARAERREHRSLAGALGDLARAWRSRLH
jgi:hypothetical protein